MHRGGYETENTIATSDRMQNEMRFGSTEDSGFNISNGDQQVHEGIMSTSGGHAINKRKKKYTYRTLATHDDKARSVSSLIGKLDHTCFI